jgi:hypothetical protein
MALNTANLNRFLIIETLAFETIFPIFDGRHERQPQGSHRCEKSLAQLKNAQKPELYENA